MYRVELGSANLLERYGGRMRLRREMEETPFFLYAIDPQTGEEVGPGGTGFSVSVKSTTLAEGRHLYAVTCKHVIQEGFSIIRLKNEAGGTTPFPFEPHEWRLSPDDDLAIIDLTDEFEKFEGELYVVQEDLLLNDDAFVQRCNVGVGDEVVMVGLFANHDHAPVARFGAIASMASDEHPARLSASERPRPAFICDMRSRTGFSGSMVVVYRTPLTNMANISADGGVVLSAQNNSFFRILGVHRGQFPEDVVVRASTEAAINARSPFKDGDKIQIPSSMTFVVPAARISEMLAHGELSKVRDERDKRLDRIERYGRSSGLERLLGGD